MKYRRLISLACVPVFTVAPTYCLNFHSLTVFRNIVSTSISMKRDHCDSCEGPTIPDAVMSEREQFAKYIEARNWRFCEGFWSRVIKHSSGCLPDYIEGNQENTFGVTSLTEIHEAGVKGEFRSKNERYHLRQTFAARIGYDGNQYHGYQKQKFCPGITVEGDIYDSMGFNTIGAGRTDRGVSAVSQVLCFATQDMTKTPEGMLEKFRASKPVQEGRLAVYDIQRVPKKFHARSSATWRRYLYMFPLNRVDDAADELPGRKGVYSSTSEGAKYDVDIDYLNRVLGRLENVDLPYNAFAFKMDRAVGNGLLDKCILYKARARVVNLAEIAPGEAWAPVPCPIPLDPARKNKWQKTHHDGGIPVGGSERGPLSTDKDGGCVGAEGSGIAVEAVGEAEEVVGTEQHNSLAEDSAGSEINTEASAHTANTMHSSPAKPAYKQCKEQKEPKDSSGSFSGDADVDDQVDEAFSLARSGANADLSAADEAVAVPAGAEIPALCIELVGNRFLRRMVRILTATAIREAIKAEGDRNENILVEICQSGDREKPARPLPGPPLALSGVGYDVHDMGIYKFMPKVEYNAHMALKDSQTK